MTFVGLTWDHPRGYDALAEAARRVNDGREEPLIRWEKQPLEGFESAPIAELAAAYDIVVIDHPHLGEAVAQDCFTPLETLYGAAKISAWRAEAVGPSLASYVWDGKTYALPLDVACQVMARRADLIEMPQSWDGVLRLAGGGRVAQSLAGPHAVLTLMSMAAGRGAFAGGDDFLPDEAAGSALEIMYALYERRPNRSETLNPIELLEAMAHSDEIALVPLIFGYVTYAAHRPDAATVTFTDAIADEAGGVLGGTGLAFSRRARPSEDLLDHIAELMEPATQRGLIAQFGGQPSARTAWLDAVVNAAAGGFYRTTLRSAETAYLRPRFDGYIAFQTAASAHLRDALQARAPITQTLSTIRTLWRDARAKARGSLDDDRSFIHAP